ncbi:MAG: murein L,D-transpeptidase catalytic domain family protein [Tannerellaceae bacterium]|nr:murein L,D-transpeptidase catalytic domain family protein [Tannerellaceae bacterium]
MKKILFVLILCVLFIPGKLQTLQVPLPEAPEIVEVKCQKLYDEIGLEGIVNYKAFEQAILGFHLVDRKNKDIIAVIDFSKPSTEERLYVIDLQEKELLFVSHVSHGKNSGDVFATSFSNVNGSNQSSLGFFVTEGAYSGKGGYSLILDGLEQGINDKAKERSIVMHGSRNANPSIINKRGSLGRSLGCPAMPEAVTKPIINTLKDGAIVFIFADDEEYLEQSPILSTAFYAA